MELHFYVFEFLLWSFICFSVYILTFKMARLKPNSLNGKIVWITGATSGIGEALAKECYLAGARVILSARRAKELERVAAECEKLGRGHHPDILALDLSNLDQLKEKAEEAISLHGRIDILINNGGISTRSSAIDTSFDVDQQVMNVNFFSAVLLTKSVLPSMIEQRSGTIVSVSSVQGLVGIGYRTSYSASKHALHGYFNSLRCELDGSGVNVTLVCPGYVNTQLSLNALNGAGSKHGKLDENTKKGYEPAHVARKMLEAIVAKQDQLVIAKPDAKVAIWLQTVWPSLLKIILNSRAKKEAANLSK
jgi:dehydrogenase/reductase SDR family protein 7B